MNTSLTPEQISEIEKYWELDDTELAGLFVSSEEMREAYSEVEDFQTGRGWEGTYRYPVPYGGTYNMVQQAIITRGHAAVKGFAKANKDLFCDRFDYCKKREDLRGEELH